MDPKADIREKYEVLHAAARAISESWGLDRTQTEIYVWALSARAVAFANNNYASLYH